MQYEQDLIEMPSGVPTLAQIDAARTKLQVFFYVLMFSEKIKRMDLRGKTKNKKKEAFLFNILLIYTTFGRNMLYVSEVRSYNI